MSATKEYRVGVFYHERTAPRKGFYLAYLRDFNPEWEGCQVISVIARSGTEAKKLAIAEVKRRKRPSL